MDRYVSLLNTQKFFDLNFQSQVAKSGRGMRQAERQTLQMLLFNDLDDFICKVLQ